MALLRAVIYCRCSTEEESQADALRNQIWESEACVREQGWALTDRYVELKSGTTTKGRDEYNRLFEDLLSDRFDIIVIKSQDRLMRNVKDWYLFLDRMLSCRKRLFMYIERKFYTADDALVTGIKAILAEEYSRELSKKINNAHRCRQVNGKKAVLTSRVFGFCRMSDGTLQVEEEEAEIIREIYSYCAAGYGSRRIANMFLEQGYLKKTGNPLTAVCVGRIIRNPLYKGTMVMNRLHYDFDTKQTVKNPREQWIYREGAVPGIVDKDLWDRANQAMTDRANRFCPNGMKTIKSGKGSYDLSGKLICSQCRKPYYRTRRTGAGKREVIEWKCSNYLEQGKKAENNLFGGCDSVHLDEGILFEILKQVSAKIYPFKEQYKDGMISCGIRLFTEALSHMPACRRQEKIESERKRLEGQKDFLLSKFLEGVISDRDYQKKNQELEGKLANLKAQKDGLAREEQGSGNLKQRIALIEERLKNGGMEKAFVIQMLQDVSEIRVHGWQLEICFNPLKNHVPVWIDYPFGPETVKGRFLDRRKIVEILKKNPCATAGKLGEEMGRSVYMVRNRMEELTKGGYIRFQGKGGHGRWEVLKELPEKEASIKAGGL